MSSLRTAKIPTFVRLTKQISYLYENFVKVKVSHGNINLTNYFVKLQTSALKIVAFMIFHKIISV